MQDPGDVAYDSATGDLYIGDSNNNVVEEITPAGQLSIVAGTGTAGTPTPGPATSSDLKSPHSLAVDPANGNLFIEDGNRVIMEVTVAGQLSIVAGEVGVSGPPVPGPATSSPLYFPQGLAVDPATGNLYIGDGDANDVLEVTPAGQLSIVAGTGVAGTPTPGPATSSDVSFPWGVAFDSATGDLFISAFGTGGDNIDEVTPAGQLSVIAGEPGKNGTPTPGPALSSELNAPEDIAIDPATGNLFIADEGNSVVEQVTPAGQLSIVGGVVNSGPPSTANEGPPTPGPAASSMLDDPGGVAVYTAADGATNLYIADTFNNDVELVAFPAPPTAPTAVATPASLTFGNEVVDGSTAAESVTITNSGQQSLTTGTVGLGLPAYNIAPGDSSDFVITFNTCSNVTLVTGAACTIYVRFAPTVAGARSATIVLASNDPKSPLQIQLSGTGVAPPPPPVVTKARFGDQEISLTSPSPNACVSPSLVSGAGVGLTTKLAVKLSSRRQSKGTKLTFVSAGFYIDKGIKHTKKVKEKVKKNGKTVTKTVTKTSYAANATFRKLPVSASLTLPKVKAGTYPLKVVVAYHEVKTERVKKHGKRVKVKKTVTVTKTLNAKFSVC